MNKKLTQDWNQYPYKQLTNIDLEKHNIQWFSDNKIPKLKDCVYIVNHANQHWYLCAVQFPELFCYCSYGAESKFKDRPSDILLREASKQGFENVYCNDTDNQPPKSWLCGYMDLILHNKLKSQIGKLTWNKFNSIVNKTFTKEPSDHNVKVTSNFCKNNGYL